MTWQALTAGKVGEGWFAPSFARDEIVQHTREAWKPAGGSVDLPPR
jgi:hypothetical protein